MMQRILTVFFISFPFRPVRTRVNIYCSIFYYIMPVPLFHSFLYSALFMDSTMLIPRTFLRMKRLTIKANAIEQTAEYT